MRDVIFDENTGEGARAHSQWRRGLVMKKNCRKNICHRRKMQFVGHSLSAPMLRAQAASYIEQHLLDPDLGPAALCKALGISRTALYELFAESGESGGVAKRIKDRRLDEALRRLTSPRHARERVAEIAYSTGFASDSTFSRAFKERFGCTPNEARGELLVKRTGAIEKMPDDLVEQHQRKIKGLSG